MKVQAAPGIRVPREGKPREYITEDVAVDVEESAYYLRRVNEGDLIAVKGEEIRVKGKTVALDP